LLFANAHQYIERRFGVRFSASLPIEGHGPNGFQSVEAIAGAARAIEAAGVDACFVTDHPAPSKQWLSQPENGAHETLDPFVALTVAATVTTRIMLHTNILVLPYRNPFIVAKSAASLDAVSNGRMLLGVGVGYHEAEYDAVGVPFAERGALTDEGIKVLRQAFTGEPVRYKGRHFEAKDNVVAPKPVQKGGIPIWTGGNGKRAIRRAVELCDGWSPFPAPAHVTTFAGTDELNSIDQLREKIAYLRQLVDEAGRTAPIEIMTGRFGLSGQLNRGGVSDAQAAVDAYGELAEAGVTWAGFHVPAPSPAGYAENIQRFGEEVIAKLR
jgi:probable F420-dependent oxidoreductase